MTEFVATMAFGVLLMLGGVAVPVYLWLDGRKDRRRRAAPVPVRPPLPRQRTRDRVPS